MVTRSEIGITTSLTCLGAGATSGSTSTDGDRSAASAVLPLTKVGVVRIGWDGTRVGFGRRCGCGAAALALPDSPRRCTLPITALRVTPPSSAAIALAERPSDQSFLRSSTLSSVHCIGLSCV
jgi:hypothetical protein